MEFNYFTINNNDSNIIVYIKKGKCPEENIIVYHNFKENKIFD